MTAHPIRLVTICLLALLGSAKSAVSQDATLTDRMEERFEPTLRAAMSEAQIPGFAVVLANKDGLLYAKGFGVANTESGTPVTTRSLFHMASVTKPFVATAVVQLVQQGKVNLDAPVTAYVPYFKLADERYKTITVRQMLTHTSGMSDVIDYEWDRPQTDDGALERYVRSLATTPMAYDPGTDRRYSNMAYEVLGDLIAKVSGKTFEAYVTEHILTPIGMNDSTLLHGEANPDLLTSPHVRTKDIVGPWQFFPYNRAHAPSSTLHSNALDMARWIQVNLCHGELDGKRILAAESYDLLWGPRSAEDTGIGLSWFLGKYRGKPTIEHGGGDTGYTSYVLLLPDENIGIAAMANHDRTPMRNLVHAALDAALGLEPESK